MGRRQGGRGQRCGGVSWGRLLGPTICRRARPTLGGPPHPMGRHAMRGRRCRPPAGGGVAQGWLHARRAANAAGGGGRRPASASTRGARPPTCPRRLLRGRGAAAAAAAAASDTHTSPSAAHVQVQPPVRRRWRWQRRGTVKCTRRGTGGGVPTGRGAHTRGHRARPVPTARTGSEGTRRGRGQRRHPCRAVGRRVLHKGRPGVHEGGGSRRARGVSSCRAAKTRGPGG